jgi:hypothetical protein
LKWLFCNASKIRDLALIATAVTYVPGFISWSIYAYFSDLGFAPVVNARYVMAGLIPIIVLLIIISLMSLK